MEARRQLLAAKQDCIDEAFARAKAELLALPEGKGGGFAAGKHRELVRTVSARSQWELKDVDCLEDLELLAEKC